MRVSIEPSFLDPDNYRVEELPQSVAERAQRQVAVSAGGAIGELIEFIGRPYTIDELIRRLLTSTGKQGVHTAYHDPALAPECVARIAHWINYDHFTGDRWNPLTSNRPAENVDAEV
jgi:hypothetical protein